MTILRKLGFASVLLTCTANAGPGQGMVRSETGIKKQFAQDRYQLKKKFVIRSPKRILEITNEFRYNKTDDRCYTMWSLNVLELEQGKWGKWEFSNSRQYVDKGCDGSLDYFVVEQMDYEDSKIEMLVFGPGENLDSPYHKAFESNKEELGVNKAHEEWLSQLEDK